MMNALKHSFLALRVPQIILNYPFVVSVERSRRYSSASLVIGRTKYSLLSSMVILAHIRQT